MKNKIIYHNADLDGFCSGAIAKKHLIENCGEDPDNIEMIGWNYGDDAKEILNSIKVEDTVIMTDISFPMSDMSAINFVAKVFVWIDHHKTAIEDSINSELEAIYGKRHVGDSASLIAWNYFFPDRAVPLCVYYVDRYDVWKKEQDGISWKEVMQAQYGMRYHLNNPKREKEYESWSSIMDQSSFFEDIVEDGIIILESETRTNKIRCSKAFDLIFEGYKFAAINNSLAGSTVLDSYARPDHDGLMVFSFNGTMWTVSLYQNTLTESPDLSVIAKKYGGGGHAGACGFMIKDINQILKFNYIKLFRDKIEDKLMKFLKSEDMEIRMCTRDKLFKSEESGKEFLLGFASRNALLYSCKYNKETNPESCIVTLKK